MSKDSATHVTEWHIEQRSGDVKDFILDRKEEAKAVLAGGNSYNLIDMSKLHREVDIINNWVATGLPESERRLWTPDRVLDSALERLFRLDVSPEKVVEHVGNILVTAGITALLNLLIGSAETAFSNGNAYVGVGDSTTGAIVGQTDLQASSNKLRKAMNATYPIASAPTVQFQSTFGSSEANYVWNEVATFNAASGGTMLNRVVSSLGTKTSGSSWSITETISWS